MTSMMQRIMMIFLMMMIAQLLIHTYTLVPSVPIQETMYSLVCSQIGHVPTTQIRVEEEILTTARPESHFLILVIALWIVDAWNVKHMTTRITMTT